MQFFVGISFNRFNIVLYDDPGTRVGNMLSDAKSSDDENSDLIGTFLDVTSMRILYAITDLPKSVSQISQETKIPINTVYNKMRKLAEQKIIKISGNINDLGRRQLQYQSKFDASAAFSEYLN